MMQTIDPVHFDAFAQMLARPDPTDLPRRAHVYRYDGDPNRRATRFPAIFMSWLQQHYLEIDPEEPMAAPTRARNVLRRRGVSDLRLLRKTGTC